MERDSQFISLLIAAQPRLRAFIRSLVFDRAAAEDVLQEANLVLWQKAESFTVGTDFGAWACKIAHFQVLAARKRTLRNRLVFDDQLLTALAHDAEVQTSGMEDRLDDLSRCLSTLSRPQQELLNRRYRLSETPTQIAGELNRPIASIRQSLYRIRQSLLDCLNRRSADQTP